MPVATIPSAVKVQEQTFQAFLNWLRIAPDLLWHSSPGRNAEGNLNTLPEVSLQGAGRRFEMSMEVTLWECIWSPYSVLFLSSLNRKYSRKEIAYSLTPSAAELKSLIFPDQSRRTALSERDDQLSGSIVCVTLATLQSYNVENSRHIFANISVKNKQNGWLELVNILPDCTEKAHDLMFSTKNAAQGYFKSLLPHCYRIH